jgi:hypothetical protein
LRSFCKDWHAASHPVSEATLRKKPDFERAVYGLFPGFFVPAATPSKANFLVVQDKIEVHLVEGDLASEYRADPERLSDHAWERPSVSDFTIQGFRPALHLEGKKVLYLNEKYLDPMLRFLTGKDESLVDVYSHEPNGYWENRESTSDKNAEGRRKYLNNCLDIAPGHWAVGWHFVTFPTIELLLLDKELKSAVILYRASFSSGGHALMKKSPEGWRLINRKCTWVE